MKNIRVEDASNSQPDGRVYVRIPARPIESVLEDVASGKYASVIIEQLEARALLAILRAAQLKVDEGAAVL